MKKKIVAMITACAMIASMVSVMPAYADETEASLAAVIGEVPSEKEEDAIALRERIMAQYGENKPITDGNYDAALAVKCLWAKRQMTMSSRTKAFLMSVRSPWGNTAGRLRWMWSRMMACTRHITSERFPAR